MSAAGKGICLLSALGLMAVYDSLVGPGPAGL